MEKLKTKNRELSFSVTGLSCPHCALAIEKEIARSESVLSATLSLSDERLTVTAVDSASPEALARQFNELSGLIEPGVFFRPVGQHRRKRLEGNVFRLIRVCLGAALFALSFLPALTQTASQALLILTWTLAGYDVLLLMGRNALRGRLFDENFLMSVATIGALLISETAEAAAVMLFYQTGRFLEILAVNRSRGAINALLSVRPETANLLDAAGAVSVVPVGAVPVGSLVLVRPGEQVPLDGVVESGRSSVITAALTGEPFPRDVFPGEKLLAGFVNQNGALTLRTTGEAGESVAARIVEMVRNAAESKAKTEAFITRFSRIYTPAVTALALLFAIVPPLVYPGISFSDSVYRALIFLVISCPCALVISIPLTFFAGIGGATRKGILFKSSVALEKMARAGTFIFDKTGTLTEGRFSVSGVYPAGETDESSLLSRAVMAEMHSTHPIALAVTGYAETLPVPAEQYEEIPGMGVRAVSGGETVLAGSLKFLLSEGVEPSDIPALKGSAAVHVAENGRYLGAIALSDRLRDEAENALSSLRGLGAKQIAVLTGDNEASARGALSALQLDRLEAGLLPGGKMEALEEILKTAHGSTVFVGDGINDAPALTRADIGISLGGIGSDAATQAADAVIMSDRLTALPGAVRTARRTRSIVRQNIAFALGFKAAAMLLGAMGMLPVWLATFADVGVAFLAILNSLRALRVK